MAIRVTIETASRAEAELIAERLPVDAVADSWRGLGVIRVSAKDKSETSKLIESVSSSFAEYELHWARVRYDDEERVFKANGRRAG
jgi:hypothetical protein